MRVEILFFELLLDEVELKSFGDLILVLGFSFFFLFLFWVIFLFFLLFFFVNLWSIGFDFCCRIFLKEGSGLFVIGINFMFFIFFFWFFYGEFFG